MTAALLFDFPLGCLAGLPLAAAVAFATWRQHRRAVPVRRIAALAALRLLALSPLVFLAARPVRLAREPRAASSRPAIVLVDRSESMSLTDDRLSRYHEAVKFLRARLLPALKSARLPVQAMVFDQGVEPADDARLAAAVPNGKKTNLGGAVAQALVSSAQAPLAVIALTDGIANENTDNARGLATLVDAQVPFIGVGFGSDRGARTLSLRDIQAPATIPTGAAFSLNAQIEMANSGDEDMPPFDLVLLRDGQFAEKRTVSPGRGSHTWLESFQLSEEAQGVHSYRVQVLPPKVAGLKCVNTLASTAVRVADEKELRVLYLQGALTWDYKFINLALHKDNTIKLTGLTRTSKQSVFRQNIETAGELQHGFPTTIEELAPFRVVVLSNLRPADLSAAQQDMVARFCGELGGGVLMIGGAGTFDGSWRNSRLEQLLPVVFADNPGVQGLDRPFHIQLTEAGLQNPLFNISNERSAAQAWAQLPSFTQYGRVDAAKPGAEVWMSHPSDEGPNGRRILMASQRYGAGRSAVLAIQNLWRWRLAKDSDPQQFDRFWRQIFRFLSEAGRQDVAIHLPDQDLHPQMDVRVVVEKQPNPANVTESSQKFFVRVEDGRRNLLQEQAVELESLHPVDFNFHAEKPDLYTITVCDALKVPICSRPLEIRDLNIEFQQTARSMETLKQWAAASGGLAFKVEECPDATDLVSRIKAKIEEVRQGKQVRRPVGLNGWSLALVLGCLGGEWLLRKRWQLT
jgi:uncharacterized membrane protein